MYPTVVASRDAVIHNRAHVASDGEEALDYRSRTGKTSDADLVLLDLNLSKMDGFAVLEAIISDPKLKGCPVIILSGSNREQHQARA